MRVVIADDSVLVREGIASVLRSTGVDVVAESGEPEGLLRDVAEHTPDVAVVDIRMPPTHTDEGLRAALEIRARHPGTGILILLLTESPAGLGYLLKDRVNDVADFAASLRSVAAGGSALDPQVVAELLGPARASGPLSTLSPREAEVLALVAEGRSNKAIAERLQITQGGVQKHVTSIFAKLDLPSGDDDHRRVLAVLTYLRPDGA